MTRSLTILGASGSIGRSTADVVLDHRYEFSIDAVIGGRDDPDIAASTRVLCAHFVALAAEPGGAALREFLAGTGFVCGAGPTAVLAAAERDTHNILAFISGTAGL